MTCQCFACLGASAAIGDSEPFVGLNRAARHAFAEDIHARDIELRSRNPLARVLILAFECFPVVPLAMEIDAVAY